MKIDVTIKIVDGNGDSENVQELKQWLESSLADIREWVMSMTETQIPISPPEEEAKEETPTKEAEEEKTEDAPQEKTVSLEDVRAKLGQLTKSGKQAEVKGLIEKFGGAKLSDVPEDKYPELLKAAEGL